MAALLSPALAMPSAVGQLAPTLPAGKLPAEKARAAAQDFEAVFINSMVQQIFAEVKGEGPLGDGVGTGVWRSFLGEEYAKSFAKAGGIGLSNDIYRALLARQEASQS
jgi:Rod binding domain-containing protein